MATKARGRHSAARPSRRGFALIDAIIGGVILAVGLAAILSLTARAVQTQRTGELHVVAASLIDELLGTVLAEGPSDFREMYDTFGRYEAPFDEWDYEVRMEERGADVPWRVTATVIHVPSGMEFSVQTLIADRTGEEPNPLRAPSEPIDRQSRYDELYQ